MLTHNDSISFVGTLDAAASRVFYEESLGLNFVSDEHFALVFDLNGQMLRIVKVNELVPAKYTVLGWHVADIFEAIKELVARGVIFEKFEGMLQNQLGIWDSPSGAKVAWFKDPDGNGLSLTESASVNSR